LREAAVIRIVAVACLVACGPAQFLVHVDTDAPLPSRPSAAPDSLRPRWLFDTLRIELNGSAGTEQRRDFSLDEGQFQDSRVSFGVAPQLGRSDLTLRLRLFRGDHTFGGEPDPQATLETNVALAPLSDGSGPVDLVVRLAVDNVGSPQIESPVHGTVGKSQVGTWPGAAVVPCNGAPGPGEACAPGGAFWMGDPLLRNLDPDIDASHERLVVVSPFFIDAHEVTVADTRSEFGTPQPWNGSNDPNIFDSWCTFTQKASPLDPGDSHAALSANCQTWEDASRHCRNAGRSLPTEAQLEYVASGLGEERAFPWGGDEPSCDDAVWGSGGVGRTLGYDNECRTNTDAGGVRAPGSGRRDRISVGGVEVVDLAGNLKEWTLDLWSREGEAYWSQPRVFVDPLADLVSPADGANLHSIRGGAFTDLPLIIRAASRTPVLSNGYYYFEVGWRCVRPGR
jgi:formylglycine-generating enzyme required for sulfatase activity